MRKLNAYEYGLFPIRKKHTNATLKKDVDALRRRGYPVKLAKHTLSVGKKPKALKARGLVVRSAKKYQKTKRIK